jgi:hypothetical protein
MTRASALRLGLSSFSRVWRFICQPGTNSADLLCYIFCIAHFSQFSSLRGREEATYLVPKAL